MVSAVAVCGICYCPWRRFSGGTGTAVAFGALLGVCWPAGAIFFGVWVAAATATNYALVGRLLASALSIVSLWFFAGAPAALAGVAMLLIVAGRSRANFVRLSEGTEPTLRNAPVPAPAVRVAAPARLTSVVVGEGQAVQRV